MIRARQLSKRFMLYDRPLDRLLDGCLPGARRGREFWALRDIAFEVAGGAAMGIVGPNGAGKSTLLKILTGTTHPTSGTFDVQGRVASLLELGTGFHPEFTGRQNVRFGARMAGLNDDELEPLLPAILDFSELGDFIDQPVRTYSSGMLLRLGFALAASVEPDVLIVDEALAVGDLHFQQKCLARIRKIHERGATILFVSHDPALVKRFCTEAILLDQGRILDRAAPDAIIDYYTALLAERYREGGAQTLILRPQTEKSEIQNPKSEMEPSAFRIPHSAFLPRGHRTGNWRAVVTGVWLEARTAHGNARIVVTGRPATLHVRWVAREAIPAATVGIAIKDRFGQELYGVNTAYRQLPIENVAAGRAVQVAFSLPQVNLGEGLYSVTVAIHEGIDHTRECFDWIEQAFEFQVLPDPLDPFTGLLRLDPECAVTLDAATAEERAAADRLAATPTGQPERG
jgi:lipopolysaccharide transport system ATP-binding protein